MRGAIMRPYDPAADERRRIITEEIPALLRSWGHNHAPGCIVCTTARSIIEGLTRSRPDTRIVEGVRITGPGSED